MQTVWQSPLTATLYCAGDFHVWDREATVCRCGARADADYTPRDPSLRDVLAVLQQIEATLAKILERTPA